MEYRQQKEALKLQELEARKATAEQERQEIERRLARAMEKLSVHADRDFQRLLKVPEKENVEPYMDPLTAISRRPVHGYDVNRLMADSRYKLSAALANAGLLGTEAGRVAMKTSGPGRDLNRVMNLAPPE